MRKINKKIVSFKVKNNDQPVIQNIAKDTMHENVIRDSVLSGRTYKVKTPNSEHAMYITINNIVLNADTEFEEIRPYEIFINSKNVEHFQWVFALTRIISAVFRKGGEVAFLATELKEVFDPKGGYFKRGGKFMPSVIAEIGEVLEQHMISIGTIERKIDPHMKKFLDEKRIEFHSKDENYMKNAILCAKCNEKTAILMDGCLVCLSCGDSKCG